VIGKFKYNVNMHIWLIVIGTLFLQESISTSLAVLDAYKAGYSPALITLTWFLIALFEISGGFYIGKFFKEHLAGTKFEAWVLRLIDKTTNYIGAENEKLLLIALTIITLPPIAGLVGAWIDASITTTLIYCIVGDSLWFTWIWIRVLGANEFAANFKDATLIFFVAGIALSIIVRIILKRNRRSKKQ
jgi:hypothetical protein